MDLCAPPPQDMVVHNVGSGLATVFPDLDGKKINDAFLLARPLVELAWNNVSSSVSPCLTSYHAASLPLELSWTDMDLHRPIPGTT